MFLPWRDDVMMPRATYCQPQAASLGYLKPRQRKRDLM